MRIGGPNILLNNTNHGFGLENTARGYTGLAPNFGSAHNGVCNFVMGDGSTKMLSVDIDVETLGYLCSRNDGQKIDHEF